MLESAEKNIKTGFRGGDLRCVIMLAVLLCTLNSCGTQAYQPAYVVRGEAQAVLGLVQVEDGWLLLRCNREHDLHAYSLRSQDSLPLASSLRSQDSLPLASSLRSLDSLPLARSRADEAQQADDGACHTALPRVFTTAELAAAQHRIATDLQRGAGERATQIGFSISLAALSLLISRAIVADFKKVIPITLAVGLGLYHAHRQVQQVVFMQKEKATALAELRDPRQRHYSDTSLASVEEVLLRYLTSASPSD